jgi:tRNA threonylcarbamoyladenosine biosynthesis protein TsaE
MSIDSKTLLLADEQATAALGAALADSLTALADDVGRQGLTIGLQGDLGAGKTALVRALLRRAGVSGTVKSPTFTLLEPYEESRLHFYHFDFYRFKSPEEFLDRGFIEYFVPGAVCLVEWPERAGEYLPPPDLTIAMQVEAPDENPARDPGRRVLLTARTQMGRQCLQRLESLLS